VTKSTTDNSNNVEADRKTREVNLIKSLTASLPLVFFSQDYHNNEPDSMYRYCDVFEFLQKIGGYGLVMLISFDESKEDNYDCFHFRGDAALKEFLFNRENKRNFEQFMNISRLRLNEEKNRSYVSLGNASYGEYVSFAAYGIEEIITNQEPEQIIEEYYRNIDPSIKDIVVYEHPFTKIGRRNLGLLYLVFIDTNDFRNEKSERERHLFGSSILYRALSEINSNIWMKKRLEDVPFRERVQELKRTGTCESYIRAVKKLAAMQRFDNFGKMISTLAEIQYFGKSQEWEHFVPKEESENEQNEEFWNFSEKLEKYINKKIEDYYLATFEFTSEDKNLFDTKTLPKTTDEDRKKINDRKEMIHLMWKASYFHSEVVMLSDIYHGNKDSYGHENETVSKRIRYLMSETMQLLDIIPKVVWKARGELSTHNEVGEIKLEGPVLVLFLLTKYAEWKQSELIAKDTLLGGCQNSANCEKLLYLEHLLHIIQYVLRIRDDKDPEVLRSVIWLISEFGHTALGINRHLDIEKNLFLLAQQQMALFGLKDYYRDHLYHVIQVCLTGWLLLETKFVTNFSVHQLHYNFPALTGIDSSSPASDNNKPEWLKNILAKWFVTSLLHDIGYILSIGDGWINLLGSFRTESLDSVQKDMKKTFKDSVNTRLQGRSQSFLSTESDCEDHGVIGALHISELIYSIKNNEPNEYNEYVCAFRAVAFHSESKGDLVFKDDPLAVLLVICDEIQEWGRPSVDRNYLSLSVATHFHQKSEYWIDFVESLCINIRAYYDEDKKQLDLSLKDNSPMCCTISYNENIHKKHSIFQAWLARSKSLQRLKLEGSPLMNFSFKIGSKIRENNRVHQFRKNETHMERLRRFIRETHYWKLFGWLQCVEYQKEKKQETVEINIDKLHETKPIEGEMEEFWKEFLAWKDSGYTF